MPTMRTTHHPGGGGNRAPTAVASANRTSGVAPLTVNSFSAGSSDPEGGTLTFAGTGTGSLYDLDSFSFTIGSGGTTRTGPITGLGGKCLDVRDAATADGTQIQLWTCNGTAAQTWTVTPNSTIRALGKCLDVSNNSSADGQAVHLWTCHTNANQRWVLP
ncbi:Ricin-type beta-trefoil lectin domain-containing protein [Micromonospora sediminimaris]|nr:Ricin-type beta-trefoil lectin domain-containing protein [Micromonospora sediminimaris]